MGLVLSSPFFIIYNIYIIGVWVYEFTVHYGVGSWLCEPQGHSFPSFKKYLLLPLIRYFPFLFFLLLLYHIFPYLSILSAAENKIYFPARGRLYIIYSRSEKEKRRFHASIPLSTSTASATHSSKWFLIAFAILELRHTKWSIPLCITVCG